MAILAMQPDENLTATGYRGKTLASVFLIPIVWSWTFARKANVSNLILGHFSNRYNSTELFKEEASKIFPKVELASEGKIFTL